MPYQLKKAEIVRDDVFQALDYYDAISIELGLQFENELNQVFDRIELSPYNYFNLDATYRRIVLKSFPYMVIYRIENKTIFIEGVFNQRKNQKQIRQRLKKQ